LVRVKEVAAFLQAPFEGDGERVLRKVAALEFAGPEDLSFVSGVRALKLAEASAAGCLLVPADFDNSGQRTVVRTPQPRAAVARVIPRFYPTIEHPPGVHPSAVIGPGTVVEPGAHIGPLVSIGAGVRVGTGSSIGAGSVIGDYVVIGEKCTLHPNVTLYRDVTLGHEVVLHSGCVIGADGFGYVLTDGIYENFPQVGRVEIGNRVEIGACTTIDRGVSGDTVIGDGCKFDNHIHVGHDERWVRTKRLLRITFHVSRITDHPTNFFAAMLAL